MKTIPKYKVDIRKGYESETGLYYAYMTYSSPVQIAYVEAPTQEEALEKLVGILATRLALIEDIVRRTDDY